VTDKLSITFIISRVSETGDEEIRHKIIEDIALEFADHEWVIEQAVPYHFGGSEVPIRGEGKVQSQAVLDWLYNVCSSYSYVPRYLQK